MGEVINLRRVRKRDKRLAAEKEAAAARLAHGVSKAAREQEQKRSIRARKILEQHRIETGEEG